MGIENPHIANTLMEDLNDAVVETIEKLYAEFGSDVIFCIVAKHKSDKLESITHTPHETSKIVNVMRDAVISLNKHACKEYQAECEKRLASGNTYELGDYDGNF